MDSSTERFLSLLFWLAINTGLIAGVGWWLRRILLRRMAGLRATVQQEQAAMDKRIQALEAGQAAMHAEQVAQRELLHRISVRLGKQNDLLTELAPTVRKLDTARIAEQVIAGMLAAQRNGGGTHVDIGRVASDRDAHIGSRITRHEGD